MLEQAKDEEVSNGLDDALQGVFEPRINVNLGDAKEEAIIPSFTVRIVNDIPEVTFEHWDSFNMARFDKLLRHIKRAWQLLRSQAVMKDKAALRNEREVEKQQQAEKEKSDGNLNYR